MNTYTIQIFINQRLWKEIPATVDKDGIFDYSPALTEVNTALANNSLSAIAIHSPKELVSIELRPNTLIPKPHSI